MQKAVYIVAERKSGFFVKVKNGENFIRRDTWRILRIKICLQRLYCGATPFLVMFQSFGDLENKLYGSRLAKPETALLASASQKPGGSLNVNRESAAAKVLADVMERTGHPMILFAAPAEPYRTVMDFLAARAASGAKASGKPPAITPDDSETRCFLGKIPVVRRFSAEAAATGLAGASCVIVENKGILAVDGSSGKAGLAGLYTRFSAACFAVFVTFFKDFLADSRDGRLSPGSRKAFSRAAAHLPPAPAFGGGLATGPFETPKAARSAMAEAGKRLVSTGMVDACFGNISWRIGDTLHISRSGSFLDALEHNIASCTLDDPECAGERPSSEYPAHATIVESASVRGVLHGHPLFSVIVSMDCTLECDLRGSGLCHRHCPHPRRAAGVSIVSGEVGGGPYGLCRTVPACVLADGAAVVYGHGVFTAAERDFNEALFRMAAIENDCRREYFRRAEAASAIEGN